ncbi:hypothetical protein NMG60_11009381 [Bertholletia excelsa]
MEEPESPRDGESSAGSSSGGSGDPNGNKEENNGSGAMRILRAVGVAAVGVAAIAVAVGGAVVLGGVLFSSDEAKKMMIAPGTNRLLKIARKDFENNPSGYFRALRALRNKK